MTLDIGWGGSAWSDENFANGDPFGVIAATVVAENLLRVEFNKAVYASALLDDGDATDQRSYAVATVPSSVGSDGLAPRPVTVFQAALSAGVLNAGGRFVDLTLDRPMSPFPSLYVLSVNNVRSLGGLQPAIDSARGVARYFSVYRSIVPNLPELIVPSRDIANPSAYSANSDSSVALGNFIVQAGDYGTDEGLVSLKKRIFRRLTTRKGAFAHAPTYGVGLKEDLKRLALPSTRQRLCAEAERQIAQEPEVRRVRVTLEEQDAASGVFRYVILVQTVTGMNAKFLSPLTSS